MTPDTRVAPGMLPQGGAGPFAAPISMAQTVSWAALALPLLACVAIWGIGDSSTVSVARLSVVHTVVGATAAAWTVLRFVLRWRLGQASPMSTKRMPPAGLVVLYTLLFLQPILLMTGSMSHGQSLTLFGISLPSMLPVNSMVARDIDELHGWNALTLLGLILVQIANAFCTGQHQRSSI